VPGRTRDYKRRHDIRTATVAEPAHLMNLRHNSPILIPWGRLQHARSSRSSTSGSEEDLAALMTTQDCGRRISATTAAHDSHCVSRPGTNRIARSRWRRRRAARFAPLPRLLPDNCELIRRAFSVGLSANTARNRLGRLMVPCGMSRSNHGIPNLRLRRRAPRCVEPDEIVTGAMRKAGSFRSSYDERYSRARRVSDPRWLGCREWASIYGIRRA